MGGFGHSYKTLEDKVRFHKNRAKHHLDRAAEWERILSEIQQLQRLEQISADAEVPKLPRPKRTTQAQGRNELARELLERSAENGIFPAEIRQRANAQGFSTPTNFPYKMLRVLVAQGKARKDDATGRYFAVKEDTET
jgi:hypothetical protein